MLYSVGHSTLNSDDFLKLIEPLDVLMDIRSHPTSRWPQFMKGNLEELLPHHGIKYEWEPRLGGWDVRHAESDKLRNEMNDVGVDLSIYSRGMFPKQRIAGFRLDKDIIDEQIKNGCNCGISNKPKVNGFGDEESQYLTDTYYRWRERYPDLVKKDLQLSLFEDSASIKISSTILGKIARKKCKTCKKPELIPQWYNQGLYDFQWFMTLPEFIDGATELIERSKTENIGIMCCEVLWWKCHRSMVSDYVVSKGHDINHFQPQSKMHSSVLSNRLDRYHSKVRSILGF